MGGANIHLFFWEHTFKEYFLWKYTKSIFIRLEKYISTEGYVLYTVNWAPTRRKAAKALFSSYFILLLNVYISLFSIKIEIKRFLVFYFG